MLRNKKSLELEIIKGKINYLREEISKIIEKNVIDMCSIQIKDERKWK